jgi:hypothetical protein
MIEGVNGVVPVSLWIRTAGYIVGKLPRHWEAFELTLDQPMPLSSLLAQFEADGGRTFFAEVNGSLKDPSYLLEDGDRVTLWGPHGGG